jgi:hypothetical protein
MKIYVVSHYYDNGESYEDFRDFEDFLYYSTLEIATRVFWENTCGDYEGKYSLREITLDTQESKLLDESEWVKCNSMIDDYYESLYEDDYPRDEYWEECEEARQEEEIVNSWLTHKGELYYNLSDE